MQIGKLGRKLARKAILAAVTPPLFVVEVFLIGGLMIGFGAMALEQSLMTEEDRAEEMERRRKFVEKVKADWYYW